MVKFYRGYVKSDGKMPVEEFDKRKNPKLRNINQARQLDSYGGILADDIVLIDVDNEEDSDILFNIVQEEGISTQVIETTRGRHFLFKMGKYGGNNRTNVRTVIGIDVDMKLGTRNSFQLLKRDGVERPIVWEPVDGLDELPIWLTPSIVDSEFKNLTEGDGRNDLLFKYILTLQKMAFSTDEIKETINIINKYVFKDPMDQSEVDTITRKQAFEKPVFFADNRFLHDRFAKYLMKEHNIKRINDNLHVYFDGIYIQGKRIMEYMMIKEIESLNQRQRTEVYNYIDSFIYDNVVETFPNKVAFENGILDIKTGLMEDFNPDYIITNKIPWNYNPNAEHELVDKTLDKMACYNKDVRQLIDEMIGYTLFRKNELGKAFILTGEKSNGKSTFLAMIEAMLGTQNVSTLDIGELGDRFKTAELFGKLANVGDDISNLYNSDTSVFKKLVTGDAINVERKGEHPFDFRNYSKLLFSANSVPRLGSGRDAGAVMRRIIFVPFDATFSPEDPDFVPFIKDQLTTESAIQRLINIGLEGLNRVLKYNKFTTPDKSQKMLDSYERDINPTLEFFDELDLEVDILNETTTDLYARYTSWASSNGLRALSNRVFGKDISDHYKVETKVANVDGRSKRIYVKSE